MMNDFSQVNWYYIILIIVIVIILYFLLNSLVQYEQFNNINNNTNNNNYEIVLYYANWCGWCKKFMPEWDQFKQWSNTNLSNVKVTKIDCTNNNNQCQKANVQGFPTVILYKNNQKLTEFNGQRTSNNLINFVRKWNNK